MKRAKLNFLVLLAVANSHAYSTDALIEDIVVPEEVVAPVEIVEPSFDRINLDDAGIFQFINNKNFIKHEMVEFEGVEYNFSNLSSLAYSAVEDLYYGVIDRTDHQDETSAQIFKFKINTKVEGYKKSYDVEIKAAMSLKDAQGQELGFLDVEAVEMDKNGDILIVAESTSNPTIGYTDSSKIIRFDKEAKIISVESIAESIENKTLIHNPNNIPEPGDLELLDLPRRPRKPAYPRYHSKVPQASTPEYNEPEFQTPANLVKVPKEEYEIDAGDWIAQKVYNIFIGWWKGWVDYRTLTNHGDIERAKKINADIMAQAKIDHAADIRNAKVAHQNEVATWKVEREKYLAWEEENIKPIDIKHDQDMQAYNKEFNTISAKNSLIENAWREANRKWNALERRHYGQDDANLGVESLAIEPETERVITVTEGALSQDNEEFLRVIVHEAGNTTQYAYELSHEKSVVSDIHALGNGKVLVLEKRFDSRARKVFADLFMIDINHSVALRDDNTWKGDYSDIAVKKVKLLNLNSVDEHLTYSKSEKNSTRGATQIDNLEGLTIGPVLEDGKRLMVIASDANRQLRTNQITQFLFFAVDASVFEE